jgi:D-alanyl-D-alanine carboxypeptidase
MRRFFRAVAVLLFVAAAPAYAKHAAVHIVIDIEAGKVIAHEGADTLWHPASLTKMMTAYVTFKAMQTGQVTPETRVVVSENALKEPPSKMGYKVGTDMTLDNALKMVIVRSANDIAVAIAETVGGTEANFIVRMNREARRLGMTSTHFTNPNGLPDGRQVTTARDIAVLTRALWLEFPERRDYFGISAIKVGAKRLRSYNTLLERFRGTNGMKTGFICASGFNMVASATRSGNTLAAVVLGANSGKERAEIAARLLRDGFKRRTSGVRPALATFRSAKAKGPAVNLRPEICGGQKKKKHPMLARGSSALEPRFVLMDPVRVRTGIPKKKPASSKTAIPIPRPRPPMPGDDLAGEADKTPEEKLAHSQKAPDDDPPPPKYGP